MFGHDGNGLWHIITGEELVHGPDVPFPTVACSAYDESVFYAEDIEVEIPAGDTTCADCVKAEAK